MTISTTTLKNAAFAIEHDLWTDSDGANYLVKDGAILRRWEPEHDDGDALRLAMALSISIDVSGMFVHADCRHCKVDIGYFEENTARNDGCIYTATRVAIVRAASAIGEDLCQY